MNSHCFLETPLGQMTLLANARGLLGAWFAQQTTQPEQLGEYAPQQAILQQAQTQLEDYFAGRRQRFTLPLAASGTPFQQQVWQQLCAIPFGETRSYGELAQAMNNTKAVRAVGAANGKNPISIIVPCHRVIASNGKLSGYAGGVERKAWLLTHEGVSGADS